MRIWYRLRQVAVRATAGLRSRDLAVGRRVLPPAAYALFASMPPAEQEHALCVHARVSDGPLALQQAALLHDVAKARARVRLWHRVAHVLMRNAPSGLRERLVSRIRADSLESLRQHAVRGAQLCAEAGLGDDVCQLVAHHDSGAMPASLSERQRELLVTLRRADDAC